MASTTKPPFILTFGYKNLKYNDRKRNAECKTCGINIKDASTTTSNFIRHLKTHPEKFAEFTKTKVASTGSSGQSSIDSFLSSTGIQVYSQSHPRQKAITEAILQDLIISCNLPLSLVDNPHFRNFMSVVDNRYSPVSRPTLARRLYDLTIFKEATIKSSLEQTEFVSVTVDIWTDRTMRGFLGVTAHYMTQEEKKCPKLQSVLLSCNRFTGSHTGERICDKFELICDRFGVKHKIDYIVCDNAANMKKAFTVCFPNINEADGDLDNPSLWEELQEDHLADIEAIHSNCQQQRLQCFAHSLQLVIRDGLKESNVMNTTMAKVTKLCSLLHTTCRLKEAFEAEFGANRSIPAAAATRWNSTLRLVKSVTSLNLQNLNTMLETQGHKELCFLSREWSQLLELVDILEPFLQATDLTQGEKVVTVSAALPCVLTLNNHLQKMLSTSRHLRSLVRALQQSLHRRFQGVFVNVKMDHSDVAATQLPFGNKIYMLAALLDPSFCLYWLDQDVLCPSDVKDQVKNNLIDLAVAEAQKLIVPGSSSEGDEVPPAKMCKLFSSYKSKAIKKKEDAYTELMCYIQTCSNEEAADCLEFWRVHDKDFPRLRQIAMRVLAVPASSAPVERVFSHGGLIMSPHRSRLGEKTLSNLIFLKCNQHA